MLDEYMSGRNVVRISKLKTGPPTGDWVTIGVIKSAKIKLASTGSSYSIFGLTDLNGGDLLLFLFGEAQHKHWKEDAGGTIVALLSPEFKDNKDAKRERDSDNVPAYSINKEGQFHVLGKSKDYGICKSLRRDGQPCQNVCLPPYPTPQFPASKIPREREREREREKERERKRALLEAMAVPRANCLPVEREEPPSSFPRPEHTML